MSIIQPEIEIVDRASESIRYLEHGWPTDLCRWHSHAEYELHLILRTHGTVFLGDYIGDFGPGEMYLTGPNLPHNWISDPEQAPVETRDMLVQFSGENLRDLCKIFPEFSEILGMLRTANSGLAFPGFDPSVAQALMANIRDTHGAARILAFLRTLVTLNAHSDKKTLSVMEVSPPKPNSKHERIGQIIDHIVENYADEFTLDEAANRAGMSRSSFSRNFQGVTGSRFVEFITRVRIGQACSMLYSTEEQVSTICYEVGFQNLANFNRHFLKLKEMTPSSYRETARRELGQPAVPGPMT